MKTVLIVEDEPALRAAVAQELRAAGRRVVTAADGREGLALLAQARPDLVLLDLMLPELDGRAVLRAMRTRPDFPPTPVVLMSAATTQDELAPPVAARLPEPFDLDRLLALVDGLLGGPDIDPGGS